MMAPRRPIVALCASHIDSELRLRLFRDMVASVRAQSHPVPLYVSLSVAPDEPELEAAVSDALAAFGVAWRDTDALSGDSRVTVFRQPEPMAQFEHYRALCEELRTEHQGRTDVWCMFCDDDDFMHPGRSAAYRAVLDGLREDDTAECFLRGTSLLLEGETPDDVRDGRTVAYCDARLAAHTELTCEINSAEYYMYCARLGLLERFCAHMLAWGRLRSPMCDVVLSSVLSHKTPAPDFSGGWLYAGGSALGSSRASSRHTYLTYRATFSGWFFEHLSVAFGFAWHDNKLGYNALYAPDEEVLAMLESKCAS